MRNSAASDKCDNQSAPPRDARRENRGSRKVDDVDDELKRPTTTAAGRSPAKSVYSLCRSTRASRRPVMHLPLLSYRPPDTTVSVRCDERPTERTDARLLLLRLVRLRQRRRPPHGGAAAAAATDRPQQRAAAAEAEAAAAAAATTAQTSSSVRRRTGPLDNRRNENRR
jgi:hypothetical protein